MVPILAHRSSILCTTTEHGKTKAPSTLTGILILILCKLDSINPLTHLICFPFGSQVGNTVYDDRARQDQSTLYPNWCTYYVSLTHLSWFPFWLAGRQHCVRGDARRADRARQDQEPLPQRRLPLRRPPQVLRLRELRVLHGTHVSLAICRYPSIHCVCTLYSYSLPSTSSPTPAFSRLRELSYTRYAYIPTHLRVSIYTLCACYIRIPYPPRSTPTPASSSSATAYI